MTYEQIEHTKQRLEGQIDRETETEGGGGRRIMSHRDRMTARLMIK